MKLAKRPVWPLIRNTLAIFGGIFIFLIILLIAYSPDKADEETTNTIVSTIATTSRLTTTTTVLIDDVIKVSIEDMNIYNVFKCTKVYRDIFGDKQTETVAINPKNSGWKLIVLNLSFENIGKEAGTASSSGSYIEWQIEDKNGYKYPNGRINCPSDSMFGFEETISPREKAEGKVIFEVPQEFQPYKLQYKDIIETGLLEFREGRKYEWYIKDISINKL